MRTALLVFLSFLPLQAQVQTMTRAMPMPASIEARGGALRIGPDFLVSFAGYSEPRLQRAADRLTRRMGSLTGMTLAASSGNAKLAVRVQAASKPVQTLDED